MKAREFRQMDEAALRDDVATRRRELLDLRCQVALGEEVRPHHIRALRRDISRMLTVLQEKAARKGAEA